MKKKFLKLGWLRTVLCEDKQPTKCVSNQASASLRLMLTCLRSKRNANMMKYVDQNHYLGGALLHQGSMMHPTKCFHETILLNPVQCSVKGLRKMKTFVFLYFLMSYRQVIWTVVIKSRPNVTPWKDWIACKQTSDANAIRGKRYDVLAA